MADKALRWSVRSLNEYGKLIDYLLQEWGLAITLEVRDKIDRSAVRIQNTPEQFPIFLKTKNIRRCVVSPQTSIYFKEAKTEITIISIYDNRRDPKKRKL